MYCRRCGKFIDYDAEVCKECVEEMLKNETKQTKIEPEVIVEPEIVKEVEKVVDFEGLTISSLKSKYLIVGKKLC